MTSTTSDAMSQTGQTLPGRNNSQHQIRGIDGNATGHNRSMALPDRRPRHALPHSQSTGGHGPS
jgi:hypothetical protein